MLIVLLNMLGLLLHQVQVVQELLIQEDQVGGSANITADGNNKATAGAAAINGGAGRSWFLVTELVEQEIHLMVQEDYLFYILVV